jgi:hypothetical protein
MGGLALLGPFKVFITGHQSVVLHNTMGYAEVFLLGELKNFPHVIARFASLKRGSLTGRCGFPPFHNFLRHILTPSPTLARNWIQDWPQVKTDA